VYYQQMMQEQKSRAARAASRNQTGSGGEYSPTIELMAFLGIPVTRQGFLNLAYPEGLPDPWTAEDEEGLPPQLRQPMDGRD
jgi:hypothetical protein